MAKTELIKDHKKTSEGAQAEKLASIKAYKVLKETSSSEIKELKDTAASLRGELEKVRLAKADLVLIYCMLLMAVTVPTWGLMFFLIGTLVYPFYYATPENSYAELFYDYIPSWMVPQDFQAIKDYYEGLPQGASIPWGVWVEPMGWWLSFIIVLSFMLICMSAILHRQWSVHERLTYPMVQLPQNMIDKGCDHSARLAPFFKNKTMWLGFAIPFVINLQNLFTRYYPFLPQIDLSGDYIYLFRDVVRVRIGLNFMMLGYTV